MEELDIIKIDPWLAPYSGAICDRYDVTMRTLASICSKYGSLGSFASAYKYFGLHKDSSGGWTFREYAPNAEKIYFTGTFCGWKEEPRFRLHQLPQGVWELHIPPGILSDGDLYKMKVYWNGGEGERIPAYADRVVQDSATSIFCAQVYDPVYRYEFRVKHFVPDIDPLLIYECHVGMSGEAESVSTYDEFRRNVLPRIARDGYNAVQIMALQEHPYYGSFGYHVSSFFAPSSRFGSPDDLRHLIDDAHSRGIAVIMDIVHSHAVKNENEGIGNLDGSDDLYLCPGPERYHPLWDSLCFDYGQEATLKFLLSNCRYWLEEFGIDGFRFDGVTSMIYRDHGAGRTFASYDDYFGGRVSSEAVTYLSLANMLIHDLNPLAVTIAEEVSGMPGLAFPVCGGGVGFDYRMAMGIPDFWIRIIKELKDEDWRPTSIFRELTNRRKEEGTISYCESHDQALVGDKTIIFRLIDKEMYWHMQIGDTNASVQRGIALHKMIRLVTISTINGGYLNFMGNEFGHPEWIDFPRDGNGWSYKYARRQWSLTDSADLQYKFLNRFDTAMVELIASVRGFQTLPVVDLWNNDEDQILAFMRGDLLFVFNWSPVVSKDGYGILAPYGEYEVILSSDDPDFGGFGNIDKSVRHFTIPDPIHEPEGKAWLPLYLPARTAQVLRLHR